VQPGGGGEGESPFGKGARQGMFFLPKHTAAQSAKRLIMLSKGRPGGGVLGAGWQVGYQGQGGKNTPFRGQARGLVWGTPRNRHAYVCRRNAAKGRSPATTAGVCDRQKRGK